MENQVSTELPVIDSYDGRSNIHSEEIVIKKELQDFITPLSDDSKEQLEENIKLNGCLDPLTLWHQENDDLVLVDGHNRYDICTRNDISFRVRILKFTNIDEAKDWMINHQLGRRNLNPDQLSYFRGLKYERMKKKRGGYDKVLSSGQSGDKTSEILAREFNVSDRTILRDAEFAKGIEFIAKTNPGLKNDILLGRVKVKKSDVQLLAQVKNPKEIGKIKNEADIFNKAQNIRRSKKAQKNQADEQMGQEHMDEAVEYLKIKEPVFSTKEDRIMRIKGNIISSINKSIQKQDKKSLKNAKGYLKKLEDELFGKVKLSS